MCRQCFPRRHWLLSENLGASYELLSARLPTQTMQAIAVAIASPPELDDKTLLLKHSGLQTKRAQSGTNLKSTSLLVTLVVPQGAV